MHNQFNQTKIIFLPKDVICYIFVLLLFFVIYKNYLDFGLDHWNVTQRKVYKFTKPKKFTSNAMLLDKNKNMTHIEKVLEGCGEICDYNIDGTPSLFFDYIKKDVDCQALWMNEAIDATMVEDTPPAKIPDNMSNDFTYGGKVRVVPYSTILNQRYLGKSAHYPVWDLDLVNKMIEECKNGILGGNYGIDETNFLRMGLEQMSLQNATVLVVGSENPWVEACVLHAGAKHVYTLEYGKIESKHPNIFTLTPNDFRMRYHEFYEFFDAVVTFSSVEHSGLGRYGDAMNPWGDRQAVARAWCASKPGARMLIAVMTGEDMIEYNAHRIYGKIMYPHLVANWKQLWRAPGGYQVVHVLEK
jgi:hypothetical protein